MHWKTLNLYCNPQFSQNFIELHFHFISWVIYLEQDNSELQSLGFILNIFRMKVLNLSEVYFVFSPNKNDILSKLLRGLSFEDF